MARGRKKIKEGDLDALIEAAGDKITPEAADALRAANEPETKGGHGSPAPAGPVSTSF